MAPSTMSVLSSFVNPSYTAVKCSTACFISAHADISRTLCIDSCGAPTSTVRIPVLVDRIGPMVLPHPRSERTTNSCDES